MKVSDYLEGIEEVFDPRLNYTGGYLFNYRVLLEVSKYRDGKNLVHEFFRKYYFKGIEESFQEQLVPTIMKLPVFLSNDVRKDRYGRETKFLIWHFFCRVCNEICFFEPVDVKYEDALDEEKWDKDNPMKRSLRKYRKNLKDCLERKATKEIYMEISSVYEKVEIERKKQLSENYQPMSFDSFLEQMIERCTRVIVGFGFAYEDLNKPIDLKKLEECIDLEQFYLAMAKQLIEVSKLAEMDSNQLHNSFTFVVKYITTVKKIRETEGYDVVVNTYDKEGKRIENYTVEDVIREYNELRARHLEFTTIVVNDPKDYRGIEAATLLSNYIEILKKSKTLSASWEFIRKGDSTEEILPRFVQNTSSRARQSIEVISKEEKFRSVVERKTFFDQSDYLYMIKGVYEFEGYIGYIYSSGKVIFERFYEKIAPYEPTNMNATYIMQFDNFIEMSKKRKLEIIKYIQSGNSDVKRVYHTRTWKERIKKELETDVGYTKEQFEQLDLLMKQELQKKGGRLS